MAVSALDVFTRRIWFRRLWLIAVGILMGLGYLYGFIDDVYLTPALLGLLIGLLSVRMLWGIISGVIVMISMIFSILVVVISGNLGSGEPFDWVGYRDFIADCFIAGSMPMLSMLPAILVGYILRQVFLVLKNREKKSN